MAQRQGALLARVQSLVPKNGHTVLVAIDGRGGAGKSSLARHLAHALGAATVVGLDDFGRPDVPGWDLARLRSQVLDPLLAARPGRYQRWDWDTDTGAEWHDVPLRATVVVEGVGSTRTELGSPWDLTVWVDAPQEVRLRRGVERDGEAMRHVWVDIWIPQEDRYVASERPHERADVIVSGLDGLDGVV